MKKNIFFLLGFVLVSSIIQPSCNKDKDDETPIPNNPSPITSQFYFKATINGTQITFQEGVGGYVAAAEGYSSSEGTDWIEMKQAVHLFAYPILNNSGGFIIVKKFTGLVDDEFPPSNIEDMFKVQSYPFGKVYDYGGEYVDGVVVYYYDNNKVEWRSDIGSGDQTGSSFAITEHIQKSSSNPRSETKAVFSCKLYDENGNSMTLTNGDCRSRSVVVF